MKMTYDSGRWGRQDLEQVAAIIYHPIGNLWLPHSVFTVAADAPLDPKHACCSVYDFNYCRRDDTVYFHNSGGGGGVYLGQISNAKKQPRCCIWYDATLVDPTDSSIKQRHLARHTIEQWGYDIVAAPLTLDFHSGEQNPFIYGVEGDVEYCTKCDDHFTTDEPCEHIWWCEKCSNWSTPQDRCNHRKSRNY